MTPTKKKKKHLKKVMLKNVDQRDPDNWMIMSKAIRAKCLDCCADFSPAVKTCHIFTCSLWPHRLGKGPEKAGKELYDFPSARNKDEY